MMLFRRLAGIALLLAFGGLLLVLPRLGQAANLLTNGPFEAFQSYNGEDWRGFPEKYGAGWTVKVNDEDGLHFMDSDTFGRFTAATYNVAYNNYRLEGSYSQAFASRRGFDFVFSQTVGASPGQAYAFGGKIVSYWAGPGNVRDDTKIFKRVGIDPTGGGASYPNPNILWTEWDGLDNAWVSPALAATAQSTQATVFIQVDNRGEDVGPAYLTSGHLDNFKFELAPSASLNLPDTTPPGDLTVSWDAIFPSSFWNLWGYDVQYRDDRDSQWQTIQNHDDDSGQGKNTRFTFEAKAGRTYTFRVRAWQQEAPNGSPITAAMPGLWQEKSVSTVGAILGHVRNQLGAGLDGVTVSLSGTLTTTVSANGGEYALLPGAPGAYQVQAGSFGSLVAPPAATVTLPSTNTNVIFDIVLRPNDSTQAVRNGDFELDLSYWSASSITAATVSTAAWRTGAASLLISDTVEISQTGIISQVLNPMLLFWYKSDADFTAQLLGGSVISRELQAMAFSPLVSRTMPSAPDWTLATLDLHSRRVYTGELGVSFIYNGGPAAIYIDEVSLAGGPLRVYLPAIVKD